MLVYWEMGNLCQERGRRDSTASWLNECKIILVELKDVFDGKFSLNTHPIRLSVGDVNIPLKLFNTIVNFSEKHFIWHEQLLCKHSMWTSLTCQCSLSLVMIINASYLLRMYGILYAISVIVGNCLQQICTKYVIYSHSKTITLSFVQLLIRHLRICLHAHWVSLWSRVCT